MGRALGVSQAAVDLLLEEVRLAGLPAADVRALLHTHRSGFFSWDDFLCACDAAAELAGGNANFASLVEATILLAMPHIVDLASLFSSPTSFARFAAQAVDANAFIGVRYEVTFIDERRLLVRLRTAPGWELRPALVAGVAGAFRAVTAPFELGSTRVEILGGAASGVLELHVPSSPSPQTVAPRAGAHRGLAVLLQQQRHALERQHLLAALFTEDPARVDEQPVSGRAGARAATAQKRWRLTARETEVLACVCSGLTNKEIAVALSRAESTIELHVTRILRKLAVTNRASLVARYYQL